jgi:hypothetical protein
MKLLFLAAASAIAFVLAATAQAQASPVLQPAPGFAATVNSPIAVAQLTAVQAKSLGVPDAYLPGRRLQPGLATGLNTIRPCGACIQYCWTAATVFHTGDDTLTGSYWENSVPVWCGNGSWITYVDPGRHWQTVTMWYSADGEAGPWIDAGCVGCSSVHYTLYGYFTWHPPGLPASHSTARLGVWLQAYGSASYG